MKQDDEYEDNEQGYIVEFIVIGNTVKVSAIDPQTLKEVSMIGSLKVSKRELAHLAVRKLHYVIQKELGED